MRSGWLILVPGLAVAGFAAAGMAERRAEPPRPAPAFGAPPRPEAADRLVVPVGLHYAPGEDLERIDVALIDGAAKSLDIAAYVLTDRAVTAALARAAGRRVAIRLLLDRGELDRDALADLHKHDSGEPNAAGAAGGWIDGLAVRIKASRVPMHLKSYAVDGRVLRTGSANLTASGLKHQDNDLLVLDSPAAAARFEADFERAFAEGRIE